MSSRTELNRLGGEKVRSDSRADILKASLALLEEGGVEALSLREAARRAGVSHQTPYHHFGDREAILAELVRDGFEKLQEYFRKGAKSGGHRQRMERMGRTYVQFALDHPQQFRLMFRAPVVDLDNHGAAKQAAESAFGMLVAAVTADQPERKEQELATIIACWSFAHGLATLLLDGKIDHALPVAAKDRTKVIDAVTRLFASRISD